MLGAIAGDIIGSVYEWHPIDTTDFPLFSPACRFTDDSVLTIAVADVILQGGGYADVLRRYARMYPDAGYGGTFYQWAMSEAAGPYNSWGNGSAMRVSPVGWAFDDLETVLAQAEKTAVVTHDHPEGIKGAQATAAAIFLARKGRGKHDIREYVEDTFGYDLSATIDEIRPGYHFDVSCQGSVPPAIRAFLEAEDYEQAVRLAISLGGDSDTLACIAGSVAEAFYGIASHIKLRALQCLDKPLRRIVDEFSRAYMA